MVTSNTVAIVAGVPPQRRRGPMTFGAFWGNKNVCKRNKAWLSSLQLVFNQQRIKYSTVDV